MVDHDTQEEYRRHVTARVAAMQQALSRVATGELEATVAGTGQLDPLEQLAARLDVLLADLQRLKEESSGGGVAGGPPDGGAGPLPADGQRADWLSAAAENQRHQPAGSAWRTAAEQAIESGQSVVYANGGGSATLAVPLSFADELIGVLGFDGESADAWSEYELAAVEAIAEQVGLALENQRLIQQTQEALTETAQQAARLTRLNEVAAALNTTATLQEIVVIIAQYIHDLVGSERASLTLFDPVEGNMTVFDLNTGRRVSRLAGTFKLDNTALRDVLETRRLIRFDRLPDSPYLDNQRLAESGLRSRMMAPLTTLTDVIGTISVSAMRTGAFAAPEETLLRQLAALLATTIENQRLTAATRSRAAQLERLSAVESALSQAQSEDDMVRALAGFSDGVERVTLHYVETDRDGAPNRVVTQSHWDNGRIATSRLRRREIPFEQTPSARLWIEQPNRLLVVEDIFADRRMDEPTRLMGRANDVRATIMIPLRSGGRWQAAVFFTWRNARQFSEDELFVLRRLIEPLGAVVARRRATLAQQRALAETELLYGLTAQLNAATDIEEVCRVIASYHTAARVLLFNALGENSPGLQLAYQWQRPDVDGPLSDVRLVNAAFAEAHGWAERPPAVKMFADAGGDDRLNARFQRYMDVFAVRSMVWLPLIVGRRWLGLLAVTWTEARSFTAEDDRIYGSLMSQSAIVLNQLQLLRETDTLYRAGRRINEAQQLDDMLAAVMEALDAAMLEKAAIWAIDRDVEDRVSSVVVLANWTNGEGVPPLPAGTRYPVEIVNAIREIVLPEPQFVPDIAADERLDPVTIAFLQQRDIQSLVLLPLLVAGRQLGVIIMTGDRSGDFNERLIRVCSALAPQVAIAIENRTLLSQAQARARRERILREITGRIRGATSVDSIMRTAAREIGEALGKQTFVFLDKPPGDEQGIP